MAIFTAIAAAIGLTGFFATTFVTVASVLTSIGLSYAAKALSGQSSQPQTPQTFGMQGALQSGGIVPRSFPLGDCATAGSLVYANTWGNSGQTPNAYLTQVIALSDLPSCTLTGIWVDGQKCTIGATDTGFGKPVSQYNKNGTDHLWVRFYDGTQTAADTFLTGTVSSTDHPYQSTRVGTGVAYVIVTALTEDTIFTGFPTFLFEMGGIPLYDPTKDSTNGGTGTQVYSNPATWGGDGDKLPAVQLYNLLRGFRYNGKWVYGLQNMSTARLPAANWNAQIAKCRATITGPGGSEPTYRSGGQMSVDAQVSVAVEALLTSCAGRLSEVGGFYKIHLGAPDSSSFSFTDDDILSTEAQTFTPFYGLSDSVNGIAATYPDSTQAWKMFAAPPLYNSTYETQDGSRRLLANPRFDFVPYAGQAQRLMKSALLEARRARQHAIVMPPAFWIVEPGDVGTWTSTRNGYTSKQFRVDGTIDKANLDVAFTLTEVDPTDYNWTQSTDYTTPNAGPTIISRPAPQGVAAWAATAFALVDSTGTQRRPAIQLSWDGTVAGVVGVQYEIILKSDGSSVTRGRTDQLAAGAVIVSQGLLPLTTYSVRGQYIPSAPRDMLWSSWIDVTTPDVRMSLVEFDAAVKAQVTAVQDAMNDKIDQITQQIAALAANQDARNWVDKKQVRSQLGNAFASITTIQQTQVTDETAFASFQTTVNATFGSSFSTVNTVSSAVATLNGYAAAQYAVTLDVNGYVIGTNLVNGGAGTSAFTITVDKFQIAKPSVAGGAAKAVFTVGNVGGVASIGIAANMFIDGTITATMMNVGTLSAISANMGTLTAGKIQSASGKFVIDLTNEQELISD